MDRNKLEKILKDIKNVKIGIIGDFCLDVYWHINESKSEISVETNLSTRPVETQRYFLGGAGNVANNLYAMGVKNIELFGVIGDDPFGTYMRGLMEKSEMKTEGLLKQSKKWSTHVYIKPISGGEEESRIDFGNLNELSDETAFKLIEYLDKKVPLMNAVIINQQVMCGIHNLELFRNLLQKIIDKYSEKIFILDSRNYSGKYKNLIHKINAYEAATICGLKYEPNDFISLSETRESILKLFKEWRKPIFITRGARGCLAADKDGVHEIHGLNLTGKLDTVGAGDSMLSGIAACLSSGYSPEIAATFGNFAAGVTVQKLYITGTASKDEILKIGITPDYVYNVDKADDIRKAEYYQKSEIEIISELPSITGVTHAIFDHDGTISVLREGWEQIMQPMMIKAILGNQLSSVSETLYYRVKERVDKFIDETTGIQTLIQMRGLVSLVKEFGFIPANEILNESGYKKIYNDVLLEVVNFRITKLGRNELNIQDFMIKGADEFLNYLYNKKIKLYLASGTDECDVIKEAGALGYAGLFEGRIFGSAGDVNKDAKKIVINRILKNIGKGKEKSVIAIGDGPVELREVKKHGGTGIGIASDEIRRFGLNISKRSRLIKAGADIIIPDYSQRDKLYSMLNL